MQTLHGLVYFKSVELTITYLRDQGKSYSLPENLTLVPFPGLERIWQIPPIRFARV